jgi:hypothetical protein
MTEVMNPPRRGIGPASTTPLRTREPRGMMDPADSSRRLGGLAGKQLAQVDTSLERIVLTVAADPVHLIVISGPVQFEGPEGPGLTLEGARGAALLAGWVGRLVTELQVDEAGGLRLGLGEFRLAAAAEAAHEAWEIRGMDGGLMVCLPGGRISVWAPTFGRIPTARAAGV